MIKRIYRLYYSNQAQIKNFLIYATTDGLSQALPFLVLPVIAGVLGPEGFGLVANFNVLIQLFTAIMGMRLVFYYASDYHQVSSDQRKKVVSNIVLFYVMMTILLLAVTFSFGQPIASHLLLDKSWQFLALLIVLLLMFGQLLTTHLRMQEKAKLFGKLMATRSIISAGGSLLFVVALDWSYPGRFYAMLLSALFLGGSALFFFWREGYICFIIDWSLQKKLLLFGLPMLPYALSPWLRNGFEKIFITNQISLAENGIYALATTFSAVFGLVSGAFLNTYTPTMYKILAKEDKGEEPRGRSRIIKQMLFFIFGFSIVLFVGYWFLYGLFIWFFNTDYQRALVYLPIVLITVALSAFTNLFKSLIVYTKKTRLFGFAGLVISLIQVPLSYYFIVHYGAKGAAIASAISGSVLLFIYASISQYYIPLPWKKTLLSLKSIKK
jgi:O-antigen/teichoic acid export membrane protein